MLDKESPTPESGDQSPPGDSVQKFAEDLAALRARAGNPILAALSKNSQVSKSVLSDAFRGHRLPTENTAAKLVRALGDDPGPWLERRRALDPRAGRRIGSADSPDTAESPLLMAPPLEGDTSPAEAAEPRSSRTLTVALVAAAALLATLVGNLLWDSFRGGTGVDEPVASENGADVSAENDELRSAVEQIMEDLRAEAADEAREEPGVGVDPMNTVCHEDSVIAASEERLDGAVQVQILWSNECRAAWGRITRWDEQSMGNSLRFVVYPQTEGPESDNAIEREAFDVQSVYTPMLIEENIETRICGIAYITVDDEDEIELSPPMCI